MREELARVTLTRKLAALTLRLWKTGERYDPAKLTTSMVHAVHAVHTTVGLTHSSIGADCYRERREPISQHGVRA